MAGGDKKAKAKETIKSAVPDSLSSNSYVEHSLHLPRSALR